MSKSAISPPAAPALSLATLPAEVLEDLRTRCKLADTDISELLDAVQTGVRTPGEFLGISPAVANTLESMALAFYRHRHYRFACSFYGFLLELDVNRGSAWRGLGACNQAMRIYPVAYYCYQNALEAQPTDLVSKVLLGETVCLMSYTEKGVQILQQALAMGTPVAAHLPYLKRAEAILQAHNAPLQAASAEAPAADRDSDGNTDTDENAAAPERLKDLSPEELMEPVPQEKLAELADRFAAGGDERALFDDPHMQRLVQKLSVGLELQTITLKDVAGFTDEQMFGGYVAACRYLDIGQPLMCMHIMGWMLYLDSRNPKYYQLVGLAAQHMKLWCLADYLYGLSLIFDGETTPNPITQIYRGEAKLFSEERHAGLDLLRAGLARCSKDPEEQDAAKRARTLLAQFGSKDERSNRSQASSVGISDTLGNKE